MKSNDPMFPPLLLYKNYASYPLDEEFSSALPNVTNKITLTHMNYAANLCDKWENSLDIGCGTGHYSTALASTFKRSVLVEVEKVPRHKHLAQMYPAMEIYNGLIENYKTNISFDFILLADVFEHIEKINEFIAKLSALQPMGGVVFMMTPNPLFCGPVKASSLHVSRKQYGHIKHYDIVEISHIMKKAGYEMIFHLYEESGFRRGMKRIVKGFSRRDKSWENKMLYKIVRPLALLILKPVYGFLEFITYRSEKKHIHDPYTTMTQDIAFKKMN